MVKKTLAVTLAISLSMGNMVQSLADSIFFRENSDQWAVIGTKKDTSNSFCKLGTGWPNGAQLSIYRDLIDNELWMAYENPNFKYAEGNDSAIFHFKGGKLSRNGIKVSYIYQRVVETGIVFRNMPEDFLSLVENSSELQIHFTGALPTIVAGMKGTRRGLELQRRCVDVYHKRFDDGEPSTVGNRPIRS